VGWKLTFEALLEARESSTFSRRLLALTRPILLILDGVGFLPFDAEQATLLFEVVGRRYQHGSIMLTSIKSFAEWAEVFSGDGVIATAIIDRLLHHSHVINIRGESDRLRNGQKAGLTALPASRCAVSTFDRHRGVNLGPSLTRGERTHDDRRDQ